MLSFKRLWSGGGGIKPLWDVISHNVGVMGCGAAEATGLGFVCFVVINPCVLSANKVMILGIFFDS